MKKKNDRVWKATCAALVNDDHVVLLNNLGLTPYQNDFNEHFIYEASPNIILTGLNSTFSRETQDRRYRFNEAQLSKGIQCTDEVWSEYVNNFDENLDFECDANFAISGFESIHNDYKKDRRFNFRCCDLSNGGKFVISSIYETGFVNQIDGDVGFNCGYMEVLVGLLSNHNDRDSRFKLRCGRLTPAGDFATVMRNPTSWSPNYLQQLNHILEFTAPRNHFIVGFQSFHGNWHEDRRWKIGTSSIDEAVCSLGAWSQFANPIREPLDWMCPANHVLAGVYSENRNGDREWKFQCCDISTTGMYQVVMPDLQPEANVVDGPMDFECPEGSAIVGVSGFFKSWNKDRVYSFYCGRLVSVSKDSSDSEDGSDSTTLYAQISDLLLSADCKVKSKPALERTVTEIGDNSESQSTITVEISDCIDESFENKVTFKDTSCKTETLVNTDAYTIGFSDGYKFKVKGKANQALKNSIQDFLEQTSATLEGSDDGECDVSTRETVSACKKCSKKVKKNQCIVLTKTASFIQASATCKTVRQITALNHDGSNVDFAELKTFYKGLGIKLRKGGKYKSTLTIDIVSEAKVKCATSACE